MNVLVHLARHAGDVVTTETLTATYWLRPAVTSTNAVHKVITELRRALGDERDAPAYIETVSKPGYRLIAAVEAIAAATADVAAAPNGAVEGSVAVSARDSAESAPALANGSKIVTLENERNARQPPRQLGLRSIGLIAFAVLVLVLTGLIALFGGDAARGTNPPVATVVAPKSIAVVRFRNVGDRPQDAYLADGIATAMLKSLSRTPLLKVSDRELAFQHSLTNETVQHIGAALAVQYVLEGGVQRLNDRMSVDIGLYDAATGTRLYAYRHEEPLNRILALQDTVLADVLSQLEIQLDDARLADMHKLGTNNVDAYLAAIEGDAIRRNLDQRSMRFAASRFRDAIALDPGFADAYGNLAMVLSDISAFSANADERDA